MDYLEYYGLNEEPFRLTPDPAYFFLSRGHSEGLLSLNHSTEHKEGFCLVTGEPGTGKTTLLNVFIEKWKERAEIAMILSPRLSPEDFLVSVLEDLGIDHQGSSKNEVLRSFRDFLVRKSDEGRFVIILVDEAQNLPDETLEELRLLSNMETNRHKLLQIVLIGQPELMARLNAPELRQLNQRIVTRVGLSPLASDEVRDYIGFRLSRAGRGFVRFDNSAIKKIYAKSGGTPRLINTLATRSLMSAYLNETMRVKPSHVDYAAQSLRPEIERNVGIFRFRPVYLWASTLILAVVLAKFMVTMPMERFFSTVEGGFLKVASVSRPESRVQAELLAPETTAESSVQVTANPADPEGAIQTGSNTGETGAAVGDAAEASDALSDQPEASTAALAPHPERDPVGTMEEPAPIDAPLGYTQPAVTPSPTVVAADSDASVLGEGRVIFPAANVRKTPGIRGKRMFLVRQGETLSLVDAAYSDRGDIWYMVRSADGQTGWVAGRVMDLSLY